MKPFCLTIAGSDPTSGAGIQADIRTFDRIGVHPFSAITALTFQTASEFKGYTSLSDSLDQQLEVLIGTYPIKVVKIGMIPDNKGLEIITHYIKTHDLDVVYDPVSISSAGKRLSSEGLELELARDLFPLVKVLTPNVSEAEFFSNLEINNLDDAIKAARYLLKKLERRDKAVVIKGIKFNENSISDLALIGDDHYVFNKKEIDLKGNVHGTGCVFSSAIAAYLVKGENLENAIKHAEQFFDEKFQVFIELPINGKLIDLTLSEEKIKIINQIKRIYEFISLDKRFGKLIPEVRMNISGSLSNPKSNLDIAGFEGRITLIEGFPKAAGEIKFGASDHTARLILTAKEFDDSINFVTNLKFTQEWIDLIQENSSLYLQQIFREKQPKKVKEREYSTMQWLIKESVTKMGKLPDIIWDKGSVGKEPMIRLFSRNSKEMIEKLKAIIEII